MDPIRPYVPEPNFRFVYNHRCRLSREMQQLIIDKVFWDMMYPERVRDKGKEEYDKN